MISDGQFSSSPPSPSTGFPLLRRLALLAAVGLGSIAAVGGSDGQVDDEAAYSTGVEIPADPSGTETSLVTPSGATTSMAVVETSTTIEEPTAEEQAEVPTTAPGGDGDTADRSRPLPCVQTAVDGPVWRLAFADDFDGDEVDQGAWDLYNSPGNAGFGLRRPAAITVEDGLLVLTAEMIDGALVSGGMAHRDDRIYGRWDFRVRTDPDPSEATSGVVLTWPQSNNWPIDGENDMYETERRADRTPFRTYIHYGADNSQEYLTHDADGTEWHDMTMEWTADRIAMYRDGRFVGEIVNPDAIPHVPHHMTVQLDAWADEMGDRVRMYVDWVRVYDLDPEATSC